MKKLLLGVLVALGILGSALSCAAASPQDVFVFDEKDGVFDEGDEGGDGPGWVLKSGGAPEGTNQGVNPVSGLAYYVVNPDDDAAAKDLKPGILLYSVSAKKYSFLPLSQEESAVVESVISSSDGKMMVVSLRMSRFGSMIRVYDAETLENKHEFMGYSDFFFIDNVRFAFTLMDEKVERPEAAGLWGTSAALYDPSYDEGYAVLKAATAKESFSVTYADENEVSVSVTSVKSEKDWEDSDKWQDSETKVKVPAAG